MARVNIKQFIFACSCTLAVITGIILIIINFLGPTNNENFTSLESKSSIIDKVNVSATPFINNKNLTIKLRFETYEFPELLKVNIYDLSLLKLSDQLIDNVKWKIESESKYVLEGILSTELDSFISKSEMISLELFFSKPLVFNWTFD